MPKMYEAIKRRLISEGKSEDSAQSSAAAIYNSKHPSAPMSGAHPNPEAEKKRKTSRRKLK